MCHQLIIVNKVDLLFQPRHHSSVVFDAVPPGSEEIIGRALKERRRPQKMVPLAAEANSIRIGGWEQGGLLPGTCALNASKGDRHKCLICKSHVSSPGGVLAV